MSVSDHHSVVEQSLRSDAERRHRHREAWARWAARSYDVLIAGVIVGFFFPPPQHLPDAVATQYLVFFAALLLIAIDFTSLSLSEATPGKRLLGLRVVSASDGPMTLVQAIERSLGVWVVGTAAGIQIGMLILLPVGYVMLLRNGVSPWDRFAGTAIVPDKVTPTRTVLCVAGIVLLSVIGNIMTYAR